MFPNLTNTAVWVKRISLKFFPKRFGIFRPNFTRLLCVPIYVRLQIFYSIICILSATTIIYSKRPPSTVDRNARWVIAVNMADNYIKNCSQACKIWTKNPQPFGENAKKTFVFFYSHCRTSTTAMFVSVVDSERAFQLYSPGVMTCRILVFC